MAQRHHDEILRKLQQYVDETRGVEQQRMESDVDGRALSEFETRLDSTIQQLQEQVARQRAELEELRRAAGGALPTAPSSNPRERLKQLHSIKVAYDQLTAARPTLPAAGSVIPSVVAAKTVQQRIAKTQTAISSTRSEQESLAKQLEREEANLSDARLLTSTIETRINNLSASALERAQQTPADLARDQLKAKQRRKRNFDAETARLRAALSDFVVEHLASMLAAEELGGPVVGELVDVDEDLLEVGFSQRGKPQNTRAKAPTTAAEDRRQRRIDEIWGAGSPGDDEQQPRSEKGVAAVEIHGLIEELMAALAGEGETGVYVQLQRDSAAARFLVRANVAQFHPKDARRLRLVDFGRKLDG